MKEKINKNNYLIIEETGNNYDVVVAGGGLAGVCAAISAARLGCKVALVQNRPVLGGNSSSEIRVPLGGAGDFNSWARETGIIEELYNKDRVKNHKRVYVSQMNSIWDMVLYEAVRNENNIKLFLNTNAMSTVLSEDKRKISEINCFQIGSERNFVLKADIFIDATGDGTIAYEAGAETRMGRESSNEFNELLAPEESDSSTQGSSLLFCAKDAGQPVPFTSPDWVPCYTTNESLGFRFREHKHEDIYAGYWWIEIGNPPFDTILDDDKILHELIRQLLGVWNYIKNYRKIGADNLVLDWIGKVPGKRESRRIIGDHILCEGDIKEPKLFSDRVAYGGWFIDIHTPGGILATGKLPEPTFTRDKEAVEKALVSIYSIPFRCLYSKNVENLLMAGRQVSVSHVALGSTRLMATCAVMGQAVGTAAYLCKKYNTLPRNLYNNYINELQQLLLKQDCYIPSIKNEDKEDLTKFAKVASSSNSVLKFEEGKVSLETWERTRNVFFDACNLKTERIQLFPVSSDHIDTIELLIESKLEKNAEIEIVLGTAETIWDIWNTDRLKKIKVIKEIINLKNFKWLKFNINQKVLPHKLYWIMVKSEDGVFWAYNEEAVPTGIASASKVIKKFEMQNGYYAMHISPESYPYEASNIISGVTRPEKWTNLWISDPGKELPQYIELDFDKVVSFNTIYLTFDTNLNISHMYTPPLYKAPECIKDYELFYNLNGKWEQLLKIEDNYLRRRVHNFEQISSNKLKFVANATNGEKSARLYEIRIYNELV